MASPPREFPVHLKQATSIAATPIGKTPLWKNVPSWSLLYHKCQQHPTTPLHDPTADALHAGTDSLTFHSTEVGPSPQALIAEGPNILPEIMETSAVALEETQREEGHYREDGNASSYKDERWLIETDRT
jgi:hypothetical protein